MWVLPSVKGCSSDSNSVDELSSEPEVKLAKDSSFFQHLPELSPECAKHFTLQITQ